MQINQPLWALSAFILQPFTRLLQYVGSVGNKSLYSPVSHFTDQAGEPRWVQGVSSHKPAVF